ncbi:MAG: double-strand break repair protein AddB, partial [Acetobacteraceae bacterium]|nr:double-strand break repair protein AddB [Acetobacteraceae bacterium]
MNLFTIPPHLPFLDVIAAEWLAGTGPDPLAAADGLILLPTRRAARALVEAFLRATTGRALLLPRIAAIGALDEAPLALAGALDLPPAVEPARRLAALSKLILAVNGVGGAPSTADRAWRLAEELASLMDEAERAEISLPAALPDATDPEFARHWAQTLSFLRIVTAHWPAWLDEQRAMNPAARQVALLDAQAAAWEREPPPHRVLVAGATGAIPAVARLIGTVARLPAGAVVLPGLDHGLSDAAWEALEPSHPQAGLRDLLRGLGAARGDVRPFPTPPVDSAVPPTRSALLRRALLPGVALAEDWTDGLPEDASGLFRLDPADQHEEAASIALILRDALERPGARAALVTPDRALAGRVTAELLRWGVIADDSAGEALSETP